LKNTGRGREDFLTLIVTMTEIPEIQKVHAIVLAAGKSERMGCQKLLLPFGEKTIIETVVDHILVSGIKNVWVVLGSHREEIEKVLSNWPVKTCYNEHFSEGMHTSVICGFQHLPDSALAALVCLGDQPFIPVNVIRSVINAWKNSGKGIVIPTFKGKQGHPTLFDLRFREEILNLDPKCGLRSVIMQFPDQIVHTESNFQLILEDIDTKNDYLNQLNQMNKNGRKNNI
jgi:molybdenum cofactor cytidylyltransferase